MFVGEHPTHGRRLGYYFKNVAVHSQVCVKANGPNCDFPYISFKFEIKKTFKEDQNATMAHFILTYMKGILEEGLKVGEKTAE